MARFAPVAPISLLRQLAETNDLGNYHLVLTHDVLANPDDFYDVFQHVASMRDDGIEGSINYHGTVIVDNSVIELGKPAPASDIRKAGYIFKACGIRQVIIVLPDELLDMQLTIDLTRAALDEWTMDTHRFGFMFVPQGKTIQELVQCAEAFSDRREITHIGIARNITEHVCGSRQEAIEAFAILFPRATFHLLGFSNSMLDDVICSRHPRIAGIDSAVPLRVNYPIKLSDGDSPPRGNWWKEAKQVNLEQIKNIRRFRNWIG